MPELFAARHYSSDKAQSYPCPSPFPFKPASFLLIAAPPRLEPSYRIALSSAPSWPGVMRSLAVFTIGIICRFSHISLQWSPHLQSTPLHVLRRSAASQARRALFRTGRAKVSLTNRVQHRTRNISTGRLTVCERQERFPRLERGWARRAVVGSTVY